ncbi:MAG TPA: 7-cyano-7-deazaguanine synthase [Phycisphaerae bacterium]|nr:7-cyano-7-deazaguanine synthase [Phycisphaerae bacterium]
MTMEKAVILCSGGLNSAVMTSVAAKEYALMLLHVRYGHRAQARETVLFEKQAEFFKAQERLVVDMPHFAAIGGNARVSRKRQVEDALALGEGTSNCYVPGFVAGLLSAAFNWAWVTGASKVFLGVSEDLGPPAPRTNRIYPDYSRAYIQLCGQLFTEAAPGKTIAIETPLIDMNRSDIIKLGNRVGTPFQLTWSCLSSPTEACGACVGCATRNRGFLDAAVPDPVLIAASVRAAAVS